MIPQTGVVLIVLIFETSIETTEHSKYVQDKKSSLECLHIYEKSYKE